MVLSMKGRSCRRLHGSNVLGLRFKHCFCYPEFLLDNKVSNPNATATMLQWWSKMTIISIFRYYRASEKVLSKYPSF